MITSGTKRTGNQNKSVKNIYYQGFEHINL